MEASQLVACATLQGTNDLENVGTYEGIKILSSNRAAPKDVQHSFLCRTSDLVV